MLFILVTPFYFRFLGTRVFLSCTDPTDREFKRRSRHFLRHCTIAPVLLTKQNGTGCGDKCRQFPLHWNKLLINHHNTDFNDLLTTFPPLNHFLLIPLTNLITLSFLHPFAPFYNLCIPLHPFTPFYSVLLPSELF